ncbi:MAG: AIPR family protein, partial [Prevotella sp.]|nr:AIPR family protein [Prevotella sp.]
IMLSDGYVSSRLGTIDDSDFNGIPIEHQIWDIERIFRVCSSDLGRQDIEVDFKNYTNGRGIPCIEASCANTDDYKSYLCIIPGSVLADIYETYGSQLLEGNVRSFLSTKVAVNKKIRETILRKPENFFAYNNGVSATAMDIRLEQCADGKYISYVKDFQIINGGQTTASLSNARYKDKADLSQVYVQMKLTEVDLNSEKSNELIRNISRSSNSQNRVSDADFFSTHPFHIRMEQISRKLYAPATGGSQFETKWFYERARGQYLQSQMRMTKSQKDKFVAQHPKCQLITKTDFAKYRNSWSEKPQIVSKGAQTNFMKFAETIDESWSRSDTEFNDKYFKDTVSLAILFKHTEKLVTKQSWFENGYRANIVTYSISLLHRLILKQFKGRDLDLQVIWNRQMVPNVISNELIKITKYVFDSITDPTRGTVNVTQWCKRDACWDKVKNCDILLSPEIKNVLIDKGEMKDAARDARKEQKQNNEINAQIDAVNRGGDFWKLVFDFVVEHKMGVSENQMTSLQCGMKIPQRIPNSFQSVLLLEVLELVKANGFRE